MNPTRPAALVLSAALLMLVACAPATQAQTPPPPVPPHPPSPPSSR
ncbi:hypothetical protein ACFP9V_06840 [Deinococcus radiopugnans]